MNMTMTSRWFGLSAVVVALDLFTKHLVQNAFAYGEHLTVTSFFDLVRYHNEGAAFSFLASAGGWQKWFFSGVSIIAIVVITYLIVKHAREKRFS
jgi:signal peptidase II